jgi:iron(III) transport system substrate-binding protein
MSRMRGVRLLKFVAAGAALTLAAGTAVSAANVNIYSARQEALIKPQLDAFTKAPGSK